MDITELVKYIIDRLLDGGGDFEVTLDGDEINVTVAKSDMGKVIGKQGKIAKAIRTIVRSVGMKENRKYSVEIKEKAE